MSKKFDFPVGRNITSKYQVLEKLGEGYEGEVYKIVELSSGITRAAKVFYPSPGNNSRTSRVLAQKMHKLQHCQILIQYHHQEMILVRKTPVLVMISEYVEGEPLAEFAARQPGGYLPAFQACHLLYSLAAGVAEIHQQGEYHGDLHTSNIMVYRYGLGFSLKLIDSYPWASSKRLNMKEDIIEMVKVFHEVLGGRRRYAKLHPAIKYICCGLKRHLILKKFPTAAALRDHLMSMSWDT